MALKPLTRRLRDIRYDARSAAKVQLVVQPGDELAVSDDVAAQLMRQSAQFKDGHAPPSVDEDDVPPSPPPNEGRPIRRPGKR